MMDHQRYIPTVAKVITCMLGITLQKKCSTTHHEGAWVERWYSSYWFLTSVLDGAEWAMSRPGCALALGKRPLVPIVEEAGWASESIWTQRLEEKFFCLCRGWNLNRPVVQPVARHYTVWAIWLIITIYRVRNYFFPSLVKYSAWQKLSQIKIIDHSEIYILCYTSDSCSMMCYCENWSSVCVYMM
jgi:hypothetical protein